jgi:Ca2+-binding EF-hand superfamily protein
VHTKYNKNGTLGIILLKWSNFMLNHLQVIAEHLSAEEVADIKQMFDKMDVNKNSKLTFEEFKAGETKCMIQTFRY